MQAFSWPTVAPREFGFWGGPVLIAPELSRLRHRRWGDIADHFRPDQTYPNSIAGEIAYGGPITDHFGHVAAEFVHRIVPSRERLGAKRFLFITTSDGAKLESFAKLPATLQSLLGFLGIDRTNYVVVDGNVTVERLAIVEQGAAIGTPTDDDYLDMMHHYSSTRLHRLYDEKLPSEKVYVAGKRGGGGTILGESYLHRILEGAGYWIFYPEQHPFSFQLYVYCRAKSLIFSEGSAIHGASVLGRDMITDCHVIIRRPAAANTFRNGLLGRCKALELLFTTTFLGTLVRDTVTNDPAFHLGVSMYNPDTLKQLFVDRFARHFGSFDHNAYYEACDIDLMTYLKYTLSPELPKMPTSAFADLFARYQLCRTGDWR